MKFQFNIKFCEKDKCVSPYYNIKNVTKMKYNYVSYSLTKISLKISHTYYHLLFNS